MWSLGLGVYVGYSGRYLLGSGTRVLFFLFLVCICQMSVDVPNSFSGENQAKLEAYKLYAQARKKFEPGLDKQRLLHIDKMLRKAIHKHSRDSEELRFTAKKTIVEQDGRWAEYREIEVDRAEAYYPNRLLGRVRNQIPPRPLAVARVSKTSGKRTIQVQVLNKGETRMKDLQVFFRGDFPDPEPKTCSEILPGEKQTLEWTARSEELPYESIYVSFREKYGFKPCPLSFSRETKETEY